MKITRFDITEKIYLLGFQNQHDITSALLRFQEHYESPYFRGKIFSLKEFKQWYVQNSPDGKRTGKFTYYTDWNGFNFPSHVLKPFYDGKFDPLSAKEKQILNVFKNDKGPFYIIGVNRTRNNPGKLLRHEVAHGLYYTDKRYKKEIDAALSKYDIEKMKNDVVKYGYHNAVVDDECHAHIIDGEGELKTRVPQVLARKLSAIYEKYLIKNGAQLPSKL